MKQIVQKCYEEVVKDVIHAIDRGSAWATSYVYLGNGHIHIVTNIYEKSTIDVVNYDAKFRKYPNICREVSDNIPSWHEIAIARVKTIMKYNSIKLEELQ